MKIVTIAEVDQENFDEPRLKGFSCVGTFVMGWSSTKNHQIPLDFPEVGAEEEQENTVVAHQKGRLSSEKVDIWPQGKTLSLGCCAIRLERKENLPTIKKKKNKKKETEIRRTEVYPWGKPVADKKKNLPQASR